MDEIHNIMQQPKIVWNVINKCKVPSAKRHDMKRKQANFREICAKDEAMKFL